MRVNVNVFLQLEDSLARRHHSHDDRGYLVNRGPRADPHLPSRFDETFPSARREAFQKKKFYLSVIGEFPGQHDARVIQNKQIPGLGETSYFGKTRVLDRLVGPMKHHHARILTAWERAIGHQFSWQLKLVVAQTRTHLPIIKAIAGQRKTSHHLSMQFKPALDLVVSALEEMRERSDSLPCASRASLASLWEQRAETGTNKMQILAELQGRVSGCVLCPHLARSRTQTVFGVGNADADLMFIGEAPGADEDAQGEPFVGRAGQLLTRIIAAMGFARDDVYIANILKCRPDTPGASSGNRPPTIKEMGTCLPYLATQIDVIKPKVLVALGAAAVEGLLGFRRTMRELRGTWHAYQETPLMITYHPSYLLRNQLNTEKRKVWEDMLLVLERLGRPITEKQRNYFL